MKKSILFILSALLVAGAHLESRADEGMWLPSTISKTRIKQMQQRGLKLKAEDLYNENGTSLKDAIVLFGTGCTGELISGEGLLLTNHHCGYSAIQSHSTVEHDYLTNGFWAMNRSEELPTGLTVSFLVRMEDVTEQVLAGVTDKMSKEERSELINKNSEAVKAKAAEGNSYKIDIKPLFYGNQYFMYVFEVFEDVRMVGAPPSSIGKFGGDTDNWVWPRHTGDFSLFRVYADKNNRPAKYSPDNVPYRPKKFFTLATQGAQEGDFTFVYGFPGSTQEYLLSDGIDYIANYSDPAKIALRTMRLDVMNKYQSSDPAIRIKYASKNANVANAWKKWQGEMKGIKRLGTVDKKRKLEEQYMAWAQDKPAYKDIIPQMRDLYDQMDKYALMFDYYNEAFRAMEFVAFAERLSRLKTKDEKVSSAKGHFKNYVAQIDKEISLLMFAKYIENMPMEYRTCADEKCTKCGNVPVEKVIENIFANSALVDQAKFETLMQQENAEEALNNDIAMKFFVKYRDAFAKHVFPEYRRLSIEITDNYRIYMRGLMEFQTDRSFYPDANLTLRIAYGRVEGYQPSDGMTYKSHTTIDGIMQKDNPDIYDYDIPQRLRDVYAAKDYGRWAVNGTVPVAFVASNHTTGGNSGSPILNARGELLGANFDRTWEGTMSDLEYDPVVCRNISVDIRYVLFVIDKIGGASYLFDEMQFSKRKR